MSQYVILPSNSSMNYFPENTLSNFKVKLGKPLRLVGRHEVALVEIIYPHLQLTVELGEAGVAMFTEPIKGYVDPSVLITHNAEHLDPGIYTSHHDILRSLRPKLKKYGVNIKYKKQQNRFALTGIGTGSRCQGVMMSPKLARILGFGDGTADAYTIVRTSEAPNMPDFSGGEHALFVYSSIVDHQIIGDSLAPLLRVVCPEAKNLGNAITSEKYIKPYYVDVSRSFIDVIDIQIRTTTGKLYPFVSGSPVILKLHFRPKVV